MKVLWLWIVSLDNLTLNLSWLVAILSPSDFSDLIDFLFHRSQIEFGSYKRQAELKWEKVLTIYIWLWWKLLLFITRFQFIINFYNLHILIFTTIVVSTASLFCSKWLLLRKSNQTDSVKISKVAFQSCTANSKAGNYEELY